MNFTMKKFVMPKFEMVGLTADLAFAGASSKGGSFEFATPKTTFNVSGNKFSRNEMLSLVDNTEIDKITQAS